MNRIDVIEGSLSGIKNISPFETGTAETLDANWVATLDITKELNGISTMSRDITSLKTTDTKSFKAYLDAAETLALGVGEYYMIVIMSNTSVSPVYKKEVQIDVNILPKGLV